MLSRGTRQAFLRALRGHSPNPPSPPPSQARTVIIVSQGHEEREAPSPFSRREGQGTGKLGCVPKARRRVAAERRSDSAAWPRKPRPRPALGRRPARRWGLVCFAQKDGARHRVCPRRDPPVARFSSISPRPHPSAPAVGCLFGSFLPEPYMGGGGGRDPLFLVMVSQRNVS